MGVADSGLDHRLRRLLPGGRPSAAASHACRFGYIVSPVFKVEEVFGLKMDGSNIGPVVGRIWLCLGSCRGDSAAEPLADMGYRFQYRYFSCSYRGIRVALQTASLGYLSRSYLWNCSRIRGGCYFRDNLVAKTVRSIAVFIACDRVHRRVAFPWLVEGDRPSGLSLDRAGDVPRVRRRRIPAGPN